MNWKRPISDPTFVDSLAREVGERDHSKPTALGTPFRYSEATKCSRALWFGQRLEATDPMDDAGNHVTGIGANFHEQWQEALGRRYPGRCEFEVPSGISELISGSADAIVDGRTCIELKTINGTGFAIAIGVNRKKREKQSPAGPRDSAIVQGALNAYANGCDELVICYVATEAISKQVAEEVGISDAERFMAEWIIPSDIWIRLAEEEVHRIARVDQLPEPPRGDALDHLKPKFISPLDDKPAWQCSYCNFRTACIAFESGIDVVPEEAMA